ncbi:UMP-CMP kinase [Tupaia chinensis]|uniref:UMP-CMP kinase n=1 Tax=Tupaia chinensis TaxID=246437 RepID=L8YCQ2_TUPCH|nr:UMP-CMP kinase [Tupaia chinensis]
MLSGCHRRLLHVLGLRFPLLTRRPLLVCPPRLMKPLVVFVLGGPGAGKGTQCARIVEKYGYTHLSAGELLRDERKNPDSQYGELIEKYIKEGKIVPICIERCLERGKSSGRSDDNRESLEKRIQTYLQSTKPIIDLYEEMGKVKKIDASKSVDEVFSEVVKIFDKEG